MLPLRWTAGAGGCRAVIPTAGSGRGRRPTSKTTARHRDRPRGSRAAGAGRHGAQSEEPAAEQTPSAEGVKKSGDLIIAENTGY
jgi:hypothetical protein